MRFRHVAPLLLPETIHHAEHQANDLERGLTSSPEPALFFALDPAGRIVPRTKEPQPESRTSACAAMSALVACGNEHEDEADEGGDDADDDQERRPAAPHRWGEVDDQQCDDDEGDADAESEVHRALL